MNRWDNPRCETKIQHQLVLQSLLLSDEGNHISAGDQDSQISLHLAVINNDANFAQVVEENASEVNAKDSEGKTPLHLAVICGHSEGIRVLLEKGVDLGIRDCYGNTPLHYAFYNCVDVAEKLLENGANIELKNSAGQTPLHIAVDGHHVAAYRQRYAMGILLDRGARVNVRDYHGRTPLHVILQCYRNYRLKDELCTMLLNKGANVKMQDRYGRTPLHVAVDECPQCVSVLLESQSGKSAVNIRDILGYYPLHFAVQSKNVDLVKLLLDNGAEIDAKNASGKTPLHFASASAYYKATVFNFLIENGAQINAVDNNMKTPLHVAAGQYINVDGHEPLCKYLLEKGALPNSQDVHGMTPLHYAVRNDNREVMELLLNAGADVNCQNNNGVTPIRYVCSTHTLKLLFERGADVNAQDCDGRTPLHHIAGASRRLPEGIVGELLDWGASLSIKDNSGRTALDIDVFPSIYMKHIIKRSCVNLTSSLALGFSTENERFRDSCQKEVEKMRKEQFGKHSLFDIFRQYHDPMFLTNEDLERVVHLRRLKEHFPIYDTLLKSTYRRAKERVDMFEVGVDTFQTPLPREIIRYILTFVDDGSLHNLIQASKSH